MFHNFLNTFEQSEIQTAAGNPTIILGLKMTTLSEKTITKLVFLQTSCPTNFERNFKLEDFIFNSS